ncbi:hypothetical protein CL617_04415 [archaeon]|nr:hypothetical protein [archaeon]|tara:strand:- start:16273 stop:16572 length:300 start_codon:yes stop_codon:yes gene_type:complete
MIGNASKKIVNGKLVKVIVDYDNKINKLEISGDFFIHPEESIKDIENSLLNLEVNIENEIIVNKLKDFIESNKIEIIGFQEEDLAELIKEATKNEMASN